MSKQNAIKKELEAIRRKRKGILRPSDVLSWAEKNPKSHLYSHFEWDDTAAAEQYRLIQARQMINVHVTVVRENTAPTAVYVSLTRDRIKGGGGYRHIEDVMTDRELRTELVNEALKEAKRWRQKHRALKELASIFDAIDGMEAG